MAADTQVSREPVAVKHFFDSIGEAAGPAKPYPSDAVAQVLNAPGIHVPGAVDALLKRFEKKEHARILDAVRQGSEMYQREHGFAPDPTLVEFAVYQAEKFASPLKELGITGLRLDNATNAHHDQLSLQPAMAITAILAQFAEAIPFGAYLPANITNNEARLAIMSNQANSNFGDYLAGASLNGIDGGGVYLDSERACLLSNNGGAGPFTYIVTQMAGSGIVGGVAVSGSNVALPVLRGRTVVTVNGLPAAMEARSYGSGSNTLAGSCTIAGVTYNLTGTVNCDTGAISVTPSAALPAGTQVKAYAYIDYEKAPSYAPQIGTEVDVYDLFARPSRGIVRNTIDAMTQLQAELSLDPRGQAMLSLRAQYAQERHYGAIRKMFDVAANLSSTWAYGYSGQIVYKSRAMIWQNLAPILGYLSQQMANVTIDHGITTLYMTGTLAAQCRGLPSEIFESSGLIDRPGIYRIGRLFGVYDVYYLPPGKGLTESGGGDVSQILCIGRGSQVGRNPIVLGDAVPPVFLPLATNTDLVTQDGWYTRNFTELNPHPPSTQGAALINVTGINS